MLGFALIYFYSPLLRPVVYIIDLGLEFLGAIPGSSCVAKNAASSAKVAVVVLSDVRSLV
jgi:hypothetical protein